MSSDIIESLFTQLDAAPNGNSGPSFADDVPVWIYGAGNVGKDVFRVLVNRGMVVCGFLDRAAKPGAAWQGVPIYTPDSPEVDPSRRERIHVIIGIFNAYVEIPPIVTLLNHLGYRRVTTFLELHDQFAAELGDRFWLTSRSYYRGLEAQIGRGYEIWSDQISRDLYASLLKFRFSQDYRVLPTPDWDAQYFPKNVPPWPTPLRLVDCGAFDGDTLRQMLDSRLSIEAVAAFEPDPANFVRLAEYVRANAPGMPNAISLFPCGVDACTSQVRFSAGHGTGSHASTTGETVIQCVSLDEALPTFRPNLIKMDIEGAELNALWGARRMIAEYRPGLAVCLYHCPAHLWQIPLLVQQLTGGGGQYFLRSHCLNGFELVLYWLPA